MSEEKNNGDVTGHPGTQDTPARRPISRRSVLGGLAILGLAGTAGASAATNAGRHKAEEDRREAARLLAEWKRLDEQDPRGPAVDRAASAAGIACAKVVGLEGEDHDGEPFGVEHDGRLYIIELLSPEMMAYISEVDGRRIGRL